MGDTFLRLRHYAVVCGNDQHNDVGNASTTCSHFTKRRMPWSVNKGNCLAFVINLIGSNMLSNPACFASSYIRLTQPVDERRLTMVHMTKNRDDSRARLQCFFLILVINRSEQLRFDVTPTFDLQINAEFHRDLKCVVF
jgi:hypothetical protein